jgi:hypothetical protein
MSDGSKSDDDILSLVSAERPGGRLLFAVLAVLSGILLILIGSQTEPGFDGGGWWNEPRNAPALALGMLFVFSTLAAVFAVPVKQIGSFRAIAFSLGLAAAFLVAIWLIRIIGYGPSVLVFALFCGVLAGFRGRRLVFLAGGLSATMLVVFRYALGLWFPKAWLFGLTPMLEIIGRYL